MNRDETTNTQGSEKPAFQRRASHGGQRRTGGSHSGGKSGGFSGGSRGGGNRSFGRKRSFEKPPTMRPLSVSSNETIALPSSGDNIRIVHLGGVEEVGRNMSMIEYKDDIIIVDCGVQFSEETTPGIDFILPNTKYIEERKHKIRGVIITHGHLDHIGAIPYIFDRIGNPSIYCRNFTMLMIKKRQEEFSHLPPLDFKTVEKDDRIQLGNLFVKFFAVSHAIPDSMGVIIETPLGNIVHTGDLRLDHVDGIPTEKEEKEFDEKFKGQNTLLLMTDSTNAENPGFSISEHVVRNNIDTIIKETKGRLILATFSSQLERVMKIIESCEKYGRKVVIDGRSMKNNIEVIKQSGLLKTNEGTFISLEEMQNYPENKIVAIVTGAQGEEFAALMRMSNKTHKYFRITKSDTVLMSSSVIPGNERGVQRLKDNLSRQGAHIIHYRTSDVHSSGHANRDELAWIHKKIAPKFFIPVHGYHYMLRVHADIAHSTGIPEENIIIPDNGMIIEIQDEGKKIVALKEYAPNNAIMVDGFSIGNVQEVVIRDRQMLAQDGIFVIVVTIDTKTGKLKKSPDLISRGFVYLKESQDLLQQTRMLIKRIVENTTVGMNPINFDYVKTNVTEVTEKFLLQKTAKRPMVIPVVLGI